MKNILGLGSLAMLVIIISLAYCSSDKKEKPPHLIKIINSKGTDAAVIDPSNYDIIKLSEYVKTDTIYIHDTIVEASVVKQKIKKKRHGYLTDVNPYENLDWVGKLTTIPYRVDTTNRITVLPVGQQNKYLKMDSVPTWATPEPYTITIDTAALEKDGLIIPTKLKRRGN